MCQGLLVYAYYIKNPTQLCRRICTDLLTYCCGGGGNITTESNTGSTELPNDLNKGGGKGNGNNNTGGSNSDDEVINNATLTSILTSGASTTTSTVTTKLYNGYKLVLHPRRKTCNSIRFHHLEKCEILFRIFFGIM